MLDNNYKIFKLYNLPVLVFMFLYVYTPVLILPFNVIHILAFISIIFLMTKYLNRFVSIIKSTDLILFIVINVFLIFYTISIYIFGVENIGAVYSVVSTVFEVIPCAIFISFVLIDKDINLIDFYNIVLLIGMLQVVCVILTMIFPELREWIMLNSNSEGIQDTFGKWGLLRMFGLARGYTYSLPLFQGLCLIIAYVLGTYKSSRYFLLIPFFIFSFAVNARIAFISLFIVILVVFFFRFKIHPIKQIIGVIIILLTILFIGKMIQYMAGNSSSYNTWVWLNGGIEDILNYDEREGSGNLNALTDKMWIVPNGIDEIIFGTGENVFIRKYMNSDIGYVVNMFYGGIIFSLLLYISYIKLLINYCRNNIIENNIGISIILYLLIANIKGNVFRPNEIINGVMILIIFSIAFRKYCQINIKDLNLPSISSVTSGRGLNSEER